MSRIHALLSMFLLVSCAETTTSVGRNSTDNDSQGGPGRQLPDAGANGGPTADAAGPEDAPTGDGDADGDDDGDDAPDFETVDVVDADGGPEPDAPDSGAADTGSPEVGPGPTDASTSDADAADAATTDVAPVDTGTDADTSDSGSAGECSDAATRPCYSGPAGTEGRGICRAGTQTCVAGRWGTCSGQVNPGTEDCNGLDDDCDGSLDEGPVLSFLERSCSSACGTGQQFCSSGTWGTCSAPVPGPSEICGNGLDDNCNGSIDEGCTPACDRARQRIGVFSDLRDLESAAATSIGDFLRGRGFDVVVDSNLSDADFISGDFDIVIGGRFGVSGISSATILTNWVAAGNALLVLASGSSSDCTGTTSTALRTMQIGLDCSRQALNPVSLFAHPATSGVSASTSIFAFGTYASALNSSAANIATAAGGLPGVTAGRNVGVVADYNCGKVLYWGSNAPGEAVNWPSSQSFWQATIAWLDLE
jgi:hypothetical protein